MEKCTTIKRFVSKPKPKVTKKEKERQLRIRVLEHDEDCPFKYDIGVMNCDWCFL
jgi:hypothetical protein